MSNLGKWEKVALFHSSHIIAKNQLVKEGSQSVSPVIIPELITIWDRQGPRWQNGNTLTSHL